MNYVFALPSHETTDALIDLFQASPIGINFEGLGVCLGTSLQDVELKQGERLRAITGSMGIWYDPAAGISRLILPLFPAPEMVARHDQIGDVWGRKFVPYMVICDDPSLRRRRKGFINSIATALVDTSMTLTFDIEVSISGDDNVPPPDHEFYNATVVKGTLSNQVFLEEDAGIT